MNRPAGQGGRGFPGAPFSSFSCPRWRVFAFPLPDQLIWGKPLFLLLSTQYRTAGLSCAAAPDLGPYRNSDSFGQPIPHAIPGQAPDPDASGVRYSKTRFRPPYSLPTVATFPKVLLRVYKALTAVSSASWRYIKVVPILSCPRAACAAAMLPVCLRTSTA